MGYVDQTDEQLLEAWHAGDQRAGATLVTRYYESIARFFAYRLGPGPDSEDLVQDTFMGLQNGIERFRRDCSVRIYLFKIARYQLLTALRKRVRDRARFDPGEVSMVAVDPSPTVLIAKNDDQKLLVAALRTLPIDVQIMFELYHWERLKLLEIAEVLDMTEGAVKVRMSRARTKLREELTRLAESKEQLRTSMHRISGWIADLRAEIGDEEPPQDEESHS